MNLRNVLRKLVREVSLTGCYTHDEVIKIFRARHPDMIALQSRKLEDMAIRRMISDVESRQLRKFDPDQGELPLEIVELPGSFDAQLVGASSNAGERIGLNVMTIGMLRRASQAVRKVFQKPTQSEKLQQLLDKYAPHIQSEDELILDVIKRCDGR